MIVSTHSSLGEITKLQLVDRGYTKMILSVNIPFKTVNITFNVWNMRKVCNEDMSVGDYVQADYHYKENFTELDKLTKMIIFDNCPICWCNLEAMDAQRIECPECSTITEAESKERVSDKMKLISKDLKQYQYSPGYKLKFVDESDQKEYVCMIFKNLPLFERIDELKVSQIYHVVGWKSKDDFKCYPLDIVNIFKIEQ